VSPKCRFKCPTAGAEQWSLVLLYHSCR